MSYYSDSQMKLMKQAFEAPTVMVMTALINAAAKKFNVNRKSLFVTFITDVKAGTGFRVYKVFRKPERIELLEDILDVVDYIKGEITLE